MVVDVLSKYVVDRSSSVPVVGVFKCSFCSCVFSSQVDLDIHLDFLGRCGHVWAFRKLHRERAVERVIFGYCLRGLKSGGKLRVVYSAVDSLILCLACKYFRGVL